MGKLHRIGKVWIAVFGRDHMPPHFHIIGTDAEALVEIATLRVLRGTVPNKAALAWAAANLDAIRAEWNRQNPNLPKA